ncbi:MAG: nucleotidyltransferase domain-containing protein [Gaiellaceae bacterium MAG52_C11]|nr:nucleotidyltransferase domain-containing protein [Candidatus Gaiellasilicea maunaloa]
MDVDEQLSAPLAEASVAFAYLFGSRATGSEHAGSDLDLAIMPGRDLTLLDEQRLAARIAGAVNVPEVDLVRLDRAGLELRGKVVQEGRLAFSADEPRRVAFEVRTRAEYLDYLPTLRAHTHRYLRQVAERGL